MHIAPVSVRHLIEDACQTCSSVEEEHPVKIDVPAALQVHADAEFLTKVVCNLMENAAKYSKPKTPITISAESRGESIAVSVADQGIGIDPAEHTLIFERFYRSRSHGEGTTGTGMGLPISRAIVEAHGGEMSVVSQPGQGSVFTFTLPAISAVR
jgi:two-component system sensor histidine kinase KdpD